MTDDEIRMMLVLKYGSMPYAFYTYLGWGNNPTPKFSEDEIRILVADWGPKNQKSTVVTDNDGNGFDE